MSFTKFVIFDNSIQTWIIALSVTLAIFIFFLLIKRKLLRRLERIVSETKTDFDDFLGKQLNQTRLIIIFFIAVYIGSLLLKLPESISNFLKTFIIVVLILQAAFWGMGLIDYLIARRIKSEQQDEESTMTTMRAISLIAKIALWSIVVLLVLENVTGLEMSSLLATLGVGSVAIALAVQNILGDLFSSVSIAFDKPFVIGDFISVDQFSGTVEDVGLKSTRLRSISGEQLVISNSDLLSSRIQNYQRLDRRRVVFRLGVIYQTAPEKLAAIPQYVQEIIESNENVTFERVHFVDFGDSALNYECVYFVEVPDFSESMDIRHDINLAIFNKFYEEEIEFAYPTQTIFLEKEQA
jgi:small-conductance mechanosensitive channel